MTDAFLENRFFILRTMYDRRLRLSILMIFLSQLLLSQANTNSIFNPNMVHRVALSFSTESWSDSLMHYKEMGSNQRILAKVNIDGQLYDQVQVRYKGHSSYNNFVKKEIPKLPFNLKIAKSANQTFEDNIRSIKLSNIFRDRSYVREYLTYQIVGTYLPLPKISFAEVTVNGQFLGLYEIIEGINAPFLARTFDGQSNGTFIKGDPFWKVEKKTGCPTSDNASLQHLGADPDCYKKWYELKSKKGWSDLISLTKTLHKDIEHIESELDVHSTLWMLALNNVLVSLDSYSGVLCHNYYLFKPEGEKFVPIMWDFNLSFGGFRSTGIGKKLNEETMKTLSPYNHFKQKNKKRPLINQLLSIPTYRKIYINMIKTILDDYFIDEKYLIIGSEMQQLIRTSVIKEKGSIYNIDDFDLNLRHTVYTAKDSLIGIEELMNGRTEYLNGHPSLQHEPPIFKQETITVNNQTVEIEVCQATTVLFYYKKLGKTTFESLKLTFDKETKKWFSENIPANLTAYYFVAENEKAACFFPKRAPWNAIEIE